jgi:hypothetical protein
MNGQNGELNADRTWSARVGSALSSASWSPKRITNRVRKRIASSIRTRRRPARKRSAWAVAVRRVRLRWTSRDTSAAITSFGLPRRPSDSTRAWVYSSITACRLPEVQ